ncbi:hypothetical protein ACFPM0_33225 [Pseudonocardia sulfidoxydans]
MPPGRSRWRDAKNRPGIRPASIRVHWAIGTVAPGENHTEEANGP